MEIKNGAAKRFFEYWDECAMKMAGDGEFVSMCDYGFGSLSWFMGISEKKKNHRILKTAQVEFSIDKSKVKGNNMARFGGFLFESVALYETTIHLVPPFQAILLEGDGKDIETDEDILQRVLVIKDSKGDCMAVAERLGKIGEIKTMDVFGKEVEIDPLVLVLDLDDKIESAADPFGDF